jgi:FkbM family methyltransferase
MSRPILEIIKNDGLTYTAKRLFAYCLAKTPFSSRLSFSFYKNLRLHFASSRLTHALFANSHARDNDIETIEKFVSTNNTVIDIGAHIGSTALVAALAAGPNGHVIAIEPSPHFFAIIKKNIALNTKLSIAPIIPLNYAVGSVNDTTVYLNEAVTDDSTNHISTKGTPVLQKTLDDITTDISIVHFLKIDVEGYEVEVLKGGVKTLPKTRAIYIEFYSDNLKNLSTTTQEIIDLLTPHFNLFTMQNNELVPFTFDIHKHYAIDLIGITK